MRSRTDDSCSDSELVTLARAGNASAFSVLVCRYQALACAMACSATRDVASAEDLAQEAFVIAWTRLDELREPAKFRPWLAGIVRNTARYWRRRDGRHAPDAGAGLEALVAMAASDPSPLEQVETRQRLSRAAEALSSLSPRYREPLLLFHALDESYADVASSLGLREATVRQRVHRARAKLRDQLGAVEALASRCGRRAGAAAAVLALLRSRRAWAAPPPIPAPLMMALGSAGALAIAVCIVAGALLVANHSAASAAPIAALSPITAESAAASEPTRPGTSAADRARAASPTACEGVVVLGSGRVRQPADDSRSEAPSPDTRATGSLVGDRQAGSRVAHGPAVIEPRRAALVPPVSTDHATLERPLMRPSITFGEIQHELYGE